MIYLTKRNDDYYLTEDREVAGKLSKEEPLAVNVTLNDIAAYFAVENTKAKMTFSAHATFPQARKPSNPQALESYLNTAKDMLQRDEFDPERGVWEEQRKNNLDKIARLYAERKTHN